MCLLRHQNPPKGQNMKNIDLTIISFYLSKKEGGVKQAQNFTRVFGNTLARSLVTTMVRGHRLWSNFHEHKNESQVGPTSEISCGYFTQIPRSLPINLQKTHTLSLYFLSLSKFVTILWGGWFCTSFCISRK